MHRKTIDIGDNAGADTGWERGISVERAAAEAARAFRGGESWCETGKGVGLLRVRACRWHRCCSLSPNGDFGTSRFNGNYILRDLTRLRKQAQCLSFG
jgi:hypothetical protein